MIYQQARIKTLEYTVQAVQAVQKTKTTKHVISESVEGMSGLFRTQDFKRGEKEMRKKVKKKKRPGITGDAFLKKTNKFFLVFVFIVCRCAESLKKSGLSINGFVENWTLGLAQAVRGLGTSR